MGGSELRPVSRAWIFPVRSPKHASRESKPDLDPKTENHGVQTWAGMKKARSSASSTISSRSRESRPRIGPSVGRDIADPVQSLVKAPDRRHVGHQNKVMNLSGLVSLFVDAADFPGQKETRGARARGRHPRIRQLFQIRPQAIKAVFRFHQLVVQFGHPAGMGEVSGPDNGDALFPGPHVQVFRIEGTGRSP